MYYRFQQTTEKETSLHVYPTQNLLHIYKNKEAVSEMIKRINSGEVPWDDVASFDDLDNYFFQDGFVCCHYFDGEETDLVETMNFDGSGVVAYDDYVIVFDSEVSYDLHDGHVSKMDEIIAVYKKDKNTYTRIK